MFKAGDKVYSDGTWLPPHEVHTIHATHADYGLAFKGYSGWYSPNQFKLVQEEVKPKPHVHAELIKQWADDPSLIIQCWQTNTESWWDLDKAAWDESCKYRIKPTNSAEIESLTNSMAQTLKVIIEAEADVEAIKAKIKVLKEE